MSEFVPFLDTPADIVLSDHAGFEQRKPWSSRIPAAIEKAEAWIEDSVGWKQASTGESPLQRLGALGPDSVALAKALWEDDSDSWGSAFASMPEYRPHQALRDFTEKVESLD